MNNPQLYGRGDFIGFESEPAAATTVHIRGYWPMATTLWVIRLRLWPVDSMATTVVSDADSDAVYLIQ